VSGPRPPSFRRAALAIGLAMPVLARAAAPELEQLFPIAFRNGTTNPVALVGKIEPWPPRIWTDHPGIVFNPGTNAAACTVAIAPGVAPGPHWIRLFGPEGASAPRFLVVTPGPTTPEIEPNDHFAQAQSVTNLPAVVDGRLEKSGDVDSYAVALRAGQTLLARLEAHVLMSPVDAVLRIVDSRGVEVAFNHDDGRTLDPFVAWTAPTAGTYVVQAFGFPHPGATDIRFVGNARCVYRLTLSGGPWLSHAIPLVARRGTTNHLVLSGWNLPPSLAPGLGFPSSAATGTVLSVRIPGAAEDLRVPLADEPQLVEREPNDLPGQAQPLPFPGAVTGRIERADDIDRYLVDLPAAPVEFVVQSAALGFPFDARLRIEDSEGKIVARADESTLGDPVLAWTPPTAGKYRVAIDNLLHRGGDRMVYHLAVRVPQPAVEFALAEGSVVVEPGKTNETKIAVTRRGGFTNAVSIRVEGLPAGIVALPSDVAANAAEGTVRLVAATNAPPANVPLHVVATTAGKMHPVGFPLVSAGENNGVPQGFKHLLAERIDQLWLTVRSPATNAAPAK